MSNVNGVTRSGSEPLDALVADVDAGGGARWAAIAALGESPDPRAYELLASYAGSPDWTVRRAAIEAIGRRPDGSRAERLLRSRLADESPHVVRAACGAVGALGLTALRPELMPLLRTDEAATRAAALQGVAALWTPEDASQVMRMLREDPDLEVRRDAAWVLRRHAAPDAWPALVTRWRDDPLPRHRVWACELAAESGSPALRAAVTPLLDDPDGHVRAAARRAAAGR